MHSTKLKGKKVGRLVVLTRAYRKLGGWAWKCRCKCGKIAYILSSSLNKQNKYFTKSCGCLNKELSGQSFIDLKRKRFGKLLVLKKSRRNPEEKLSWLCKCDCGNFKQIRGDSLRAGKTKSCGCEWKSKLPIGEASFNRLFDNYKYRAKRKRLSFSLTRDDFRKLTKQNCFYCGVEPSQVKQAKTYKGVYLYNGIDRQDNKKGYTVNNSLSCCKTCNFAKYKMTTLEFRNWIERLIKFYAK